MMLGIILLLMATLLVGSNINGSKSWINLGFMNLGFRTVENFDIIYSIYD